MTTEVPLVTVDHRAHVRVLTLNDPRRRNAIGPQLRDELAARVAGVAADDDAHALVVAGAGSAFCSGADLPAVFGGPDRPVHVLRDELKHIYDSFLGIRELPIPTIAAVQGPAIGAGLNLALCCDLCVVGSNATLAASFARIGLHPGGGSTYFLVRALGEQRALRLLLEGGSLSAPEAVEAGLALSVEDEPLDAALVLADTITTLAPELVRDIKQSVRIASTDGFEASVAFEAWPQASTAVTPRVKEAVARFTDKNC